MTQEINREEREDKLFLFALNNLDGKIYRDKEDGSPALALRRINVDEGERYTLFKWISY